MQASVSLQADLRASDIDVCMVSETHLNNKIPDSGVGIMPFNLYRRDKDWGNNYKRKNGGVAMYIRQNLKVLQVIREIYFEIVSITLGLPRFVGLRDATC